MSVCVFGSINLDYFVRVASLPLPGETIPSFHSFTSPGGKGANQAIAAARAGSPVRLFAAVGSDDVGQILINHAEMHNVDVSAVIVKQDLASGAAFITVSDDGENTVVVAGNANNHLDAPEDHMMIGCTVALSQLETSIAAAADFLRMGKAHGAICILNAAPALPEARAIFGEADILIFNTVEFATYLGRETENLEDVRELFTRPDQRAIITLGAQGSAMVDQTSIIHVPAARIDSVVDTTGAGDAFCGTLAALTEPGADWQSLLVAANAAAGKCVQHQGAV